MEQGQFFSGAIGIRLCLNCITYGQLNVAVSSTTHPSNGWLYSKKTENFTTNVTHKSNLFKSFFDYYVSNFYEKSFAVLRFQYILFQQKH